MWALIPLKIFSNSKQRLSGFLMPGERVNLFQAMVKDLLTVVSSHPDIIGTTLVSDEPVAREFAHQYGLDLITEAELSASGLNGVVQAAATMLAERGIDELMVIHGDLPLLNADDISLLIAAHKKALAPAVTIAQDTAGQGTNCLLCNPAAKMKFQYGLGSLQKHQQHARLLGAELQTIDLPRAGFDIDVPDDLFQLVNNPQLAKARHTRQYLERSGIAANIKAIQKEPAALHARRAAVNFKQPN